MSAVYEIGPFRLDARVAALTYDGKPVPLGPRAVAVLTALVERAREHVPKDRILEAAWPGRVVEESNLSVQISAIRRALARAPGGDRWVETLSRRGYRFVGPVTKSDGGSARRDSSTHSNLPRSLTSFVGRDRELDEVQARLTSNRLVTVSGVGGIGKTRLALEVGANARDRYPDGVWFIDLAPISDERLVIQRVASTLGIKDQPARLAHEALLQYVKDLRLLLVLDNCEHLLHACADLTQRLLQSAPHVNVLATSRERLRVEGESAYPLSTLASPAANSSLDATAALRYSSLCLFRDRAKAASPQFRIHHGNVDVIAEICRELDGIPLAIELAAARVRTLPLETMASRLRDRFRLLAGADTPVARQQTLRASIDWSVDLLDLAERTLLRRLSVFTGGWTAEAAECVTASQNLEQSEVLFVLISLVEKSLVQFDVDHGRYGLLETIRAYASDLLIASGEEKAVRARHLDFYFTLAEATDPASAAATNVWLANMDADHGNVLAAATFAAREQLQASRSLHVMSIMYRYWFHRGLLSVGYRMILDTLNREDTKRPSDDRYRALFAAGIIGRSLGPRNTEAIACVQEAMSIAQASDNEPRVGMCLSLLGNLEHARRDNGLAIEYLQRSIALGRRLQSDEILTRALNGLAEIYLADGDLERARPLLEEALSTGRRLHDPVVTALRLFNIVTVEASTSAMQRAVERLREALALVEELPSNRTTQALFDVCIGVGALAGTWSFAAKMYGRAAAQLECAGSCRDPADEAFLSPLITRTRSELGDDVFATAASAGRALSYEAAIAEVRAWLAGFPQ
jgi:non-specific serine/threonine protein kinase